MNFTPRIRLLVGGDIHLERMEAFTVREGAEDKQIYATLRAWPEQFVALDLFYNFRMAIRLEAHKRKLIYAPPRNSGNLMEISLNKEDRWLGLGVVFHDL